MVIDLEDSNETVRVSWEEHLDKCELAKFEQNRKDNQMFQKTIQATEKEERFWVKF